MSTPRPCRSRALLTVACLALALVAGAVVLVVTYRHPALQGAVDAAVGTTGIGVTLAVAHALR